MIFYCSISIYQISGIFRALSLSTENENALVECYHGHVIKDRLWDKAAADELSQPTWPESNGFRAGGI